MALSFLIIRLGIPEVTQHFMTVSDTQITLPILPSPISPSATLPCPAHPGHFTPLPKETRLPWGMVPAVTGAENYLLTTTFLFLLLEQPLSLSSSSSLLCFFNNDHREPNLQVRSPG